ncbi:MAG: D-alanyl-D-alanine carboxypeptidase [Candidatus Liptonbacteria bacterium]|nr:D-alanyl-D-alanine carboxypeptidase [Candidatus Liptonbacteria bacterium]
MIRPERTAYTIILTALLAFFLIIIGQSPGGGRESGGVERVTGRFPAVPVPQFILEPAPLAAPTATLPAADGRLRAGSIPVFEPQPVTSSPPVLQSELGLDRSKSYQTNSAAPPLIAAHAVLVADASRAQNYLALNFDDHWPLASLTKLMAAVVVMGQMDLDREITLKPDMLLSPGERGTAHSLFQAGERYRVRDLLGLGLVASDNDAIDALAHAYGYAEFVRQMNQQAQAWGLRDTSYIEPTGLSVSNQSTPRDLATLVGRIRAEQPEVFRITRQPSWTATELSRHTRRTALSTNRFAGRADFLGGKTGYTDDAQGNLISLFEYRGRPVLVIILGSEDRFGETTKLLGWFKETVNQGG